MSILFKKYARLKKAVGGNREKYGYEETFGMPQEEQHHITMPNKNIRRILAELEFSIRLSEASENRFDAYIEQSLDLLQDEMTNEGVITKTAIEKAEELLMPIASAAKEYTLICASHAHIDMNWMWGWQETVAATLATFKTILNLMEEYPQFCFSQSQASVYKIVEEFDPGMMDQIKKYIAQGRWEITATAWVETDKNMPNTESLLRHIRYTKDYLQNTWGVDPSSLEVDFSPDTFGHSANVPEINLHGNVKYYYHCRGLDGNHALFRWKAPSGKEILVYREQYWYNSGITPQIGVGIIDISKRCAGLKTGLIVYGVGDHGGGPTRRDVERIMEMNEWKIYPNVKFGTLREYFKAAESVWDNLTVIDHELNAIFQGCYTTQSRIKRGNRKSEAALLDAEILSSVAKIKTGSAFMPAQFEKAWQKVLFTHFHDILTGSCVQESREHAMGLFADAMAVANTQHSNAITAIAKNIDTSMIVRCETDGDINASQSEGAGAGYGLENYHGVPSPERGAGRTRVFHLFNTSAHERLQPVEITVWDWVGDMRCVKVEDAFGNPLPFQMVDHGLQQYWDHKYFRFLVYTPVPAVGYTTVVLKEYEAEGYNFYYQPDGRTQHGFNNVVLENEFIRAEFDRRSGGMISYTDKETGKEFVKPGEYGGLVYVETEAASSNAWNIGKYLKYEKIDSVTNIRTAMWGNLRKSFFCEANIKNSNIKMRVSLDKNAKQLDFEYTIDWHETGKGGPIPVLIYKLPFNFDTNEYITENAGGIIRRPGQNIDMPSLQFIAAEYESGKALSVVTDCKYGYRGTENSLIATLINSSTSPDPYPERGIHKIRLAVGISSSCGKALSEFATDYNHMISYTSSNLHKGTLPPEKSFISLEKATTAVLSSVRISALDGAAVIGGYEMCGKESPVAITFDFDVKEAYFTDLMENKLCGCVAVDGNRISFTAKPYSVFTIKVKQ